MGSKQGGGAAHGAGLEGELWGGGPPPLPASRAPPPVPRRWGRPAITVAGEVPAANRLLRSFTAVVHGFAYLPRGGFTRGFPTDLRGFPPEGDLVADEAARAVRTLARAAAGLR